MGTSPRCSLRVHTRSDLSDLVFRVPGGRILALASLVAFLPGAELRAEFADPAPPQVHVVAEGATAPEPRDHDRLVFHAPPKPRHPEAVDAEWPRFLGPSDDGISPETHLLARFPEGGPRVVWEMEKGTGYTSPVIAGGRLVFFDRLGDEEIVECFDPETGRRYWSEAYPVDYRDRYGFSNGPRASAVIEGGRIITFGVTGVLSCLDLETGTLIWRRHLQDEFSVVDSFFGHSACPVVHEGKVLVPLGTEDQLALAAFDLESGRLVWGTRHEWHADYASPVILELQGAPRLISFQGGESRPAIGGLLAIDPEDGSVLDAYPWRSEIVESVNSAGPVAVGDDRVFISATYGKGGVLLRFTEELKWEEVWRAPRFDLHWMTPLHLDGHLYGFRGRNEPDASLASYAVESGEENWDHDELWEIALPNGRDYRMKYLRGSLLHADGRAYALGELGTLGILQLSPEGVETLDRTQLFVARATWSLPVLHRGLLYVSQHEPDMENRPRRLICYDLRAE